MSLVNIVSTILAVPKHSYFRYDIQPTACDIIIIYATEKTKMSWLIS